MHVAAGAALMQGARRTPSGCIESTARGCSGEAAGGRLLGAAHARGAWRTEQSPAAASSTEGGRADGGSMMGCARAGRARCMALGGGGKGVWWADRGKARWCGVRNERHGKIGMLGIVNQLDRVGTIYGAAP